MAGIGVIEWILVPTRSFDATVSMMSEALGLAVADMGEPATDTQFHRFAMFKLPNGMTIEVLEPKAEFADLYNAPMPSLTVDNVLATRAALERLGVEILTRVFESGDGWGWVYFREPGGGVWQIQGAVDKSE